jgi:hypothetical protein
MVSITSKPLAEFLLGAAFFSPVKVEVSSNKIDPSHPYRIIKKKIDMLMQIFKKYKHLICFRRFIKLYFKI